MITTVTLNPAIDREYFVNDDNGIKNEHYIYAEENIRVYPGGKGLLSAINLRKLGYQDVQNIGFIGGKQGLFFEKMVQEYNVTTNYVYTQNEIRNNIKIICCNPVTFTHYNDYCYKVELSDVEELLKRFARSIVSSDLIMITGSIPQGVDFNIYQKLIKICHQKGKEVFLQASGEALNLALKEKPKFVTPYFKHTNKILDEILVDFNDYIRSGKKLLAKGVQYVIIPYNYDHLLFEGDKVFCLSFENLSLISWLGAGDAYNTAFFDYIYQYGFDFIEANRYGGAAALSVAEHKDVFLQERQQIETCLDRVNIKQLEVD